jgi:hypothetical protein
MPGPEDKSFAIPKAMADLSDLQRFGAPLPSHGRRDRLRDRRKRAPSALPRPSKNLIGYVTFKRTHTRPSATWTWLS